MKHFLKKFGRRNAVDKECHKMVLKNQSTVMEFVLRIPSVIETAKEKNPFSKKNFQTEPIGSFILVVLEWEAISCFCIILVVWPWR